MGGGAGGPYTDTGGEGSGGGGGAYTAGDGMTSLRKILLLGRLKVIPGGGGGGIGSRLAFGVGGIATAVATVAIRSSILCKQIMLSSLITIF